jgi:hypothetical protein
VADPVIHPITDPATRRDRISQACDGASADHWITLREGPMQVPAVHLDQDLLVYRVDNGRLLAALQEQLGHRPASLKQLQNNEAHADTQDLLHALLIEKASDSRGPILRELKRVAVQTEPLLIDAEGVVVNGNRRLAAMRLLLSEDPKLFHRFQRPLVAVLPKDVSRSDVEYIETALQLAPTRVTAAAGSGIGRTGAGEDLPLRHLQNPFSVFRRCRLRKTVSTVAGTAQRSAGLTGETLACDRIVADQRAQAPGPDHGPSVPLRSAYH